MESNNEPKGNVFERNINKKGKNAKKDNLKNKQTQQSKKQNTNPSQIENRFANLANLPMDEEVPTSDNTSTLSDFSFGDEKWSMKKISDIFSRLSKESDPKRIARIVEKGIHQIVYEAAEKPELIVKFVTCALERVNLEKNVLDSIKRLRILEEIELECSEMLQVLIKKLKQLGKEKLNNKISPKKIKIIQEREQEIIGFISYFVFKHPILTKDEYMLIYEIIEWNQISYLQGNRFISFFVFS
jgi:hypothetical protein